MLCNINHSGTCLRQPPVGKSYLALTERWLHYRGRLQCFSAMLVLFGVREAGCSERWLPYTVTIIDRFHYILYLSNACAVIVALQSELNTSQ